MSSHLCTLCFYRLEKEEKLNFAFLTCMDGNSSLKSIDTSYQYGNPREDDRMLQSLRWLETEEVNMFQDEVANAAKAVRTQSRKNSFTNNSVQKQGDKNSEVAWLNVTELDQLQKCLDTCVDRWKSAAPEARKKMWDLFSVSGIYLCVCRHGHLIFICDMIRSGELWV
jgi:hypothetical protein